MEEILLKFIDNSPVLALLAIVLLVSFRTQTKRDEQVSIEREKFWEAIQKVNDLSHKLSEGILKTILIQAEDFQKYIEATMQAHMYQKIEHEQMIELLKKLNGK